MHADAILARAHDPAGAAGGLPQGAGWIALSGQNRLQLPRGAAPQMQSGLMVFDLALPLVATTRILDHRTADFAVSLVFDPLVGFGLMLRQGNRLTRHLLPGARADGNGTAQLHFRWNAPLGTWSLWFCPTSNDIACNASGTDPQPVDWETVSALCQAGATQSRSPALLWFGATQGDSPPPPAAWIGPRTPVDTPAGPVPASALRPGDRVLTRDNGAVPVRALRRADLPASGSYAPVRLRAPFFLKGSDALVSPDQQVALTGIEVEYLFGEDEVLVQARHLVDGARALRETRSGLLPWVAIDLGPKDLILAFGCALATTGDNGNWRCLERFEAITLQSMRRRGAVRSAA